MESYQAPPPYQQILIQQFLKEVSNNIAMYIKIYAQNLFLAFTFNKVKVIDYCKSYMHALVFTHIDNLII